jgi:hypothetical protein
MHREALGHAYWRQLGHHWQAEKWHRLVTGPQCPPDEDKEPGLAILEMADPNVQNKIMTSERDLKSLRDPIPAKGQAPNKREREGRVPATMPRKRIGNPGGYRPFRRNVEDLEMGKLSDGFECASVTGGHACMLTAGHISGLTCRQPPTLQRRRDASQGAETYHQKEYINQAANRRGADGENEDADILNQSYGQIAVKFFAKVFSTATTFGTQS